MSHPRLPSAPPPIHPAPVSSAPLQGSAGRGGRAAWRSPALTGWLVGAAILATAVASTGVVTAVGRAVLLEDLRNYLRRSAETTAALIDSGRLAALTDSAQTGNADYRALAVPLTTLLRTNPDIRFAYAGTMRGDTMSFVLDGDTTAERAWVGQHDLPTAGERELARAGRTVVERAPSPTAWGTGIRAYAPIATLPGGALAYAGVTMDATRYEAWVRRIYQAAGLGLAVAFALALLGGVRAARLERDRVAAEREIAEAREREEMAAGERRTLELRLERKQRMEALGTLAGGVAHDFNNLLSVILGNAELILDEESPDSSAAESAGAIRIAATRARDVTRQILVFANPHAEGRHAISLAPVVEETVQLLASTLPSSIQLLWRAPEVEVTAIADGSQITQVLMNLGVNASQALPGRRGTIEFAVEGVDLGGREANRLALVAGPHARLTVRDDGEGMSDEVRQRIFEPFFTTKKVGEGSGLGLSVVDGVVRGHLGAIDVRSAPGQGATFDIYLPAAGTVPPDESEHRSPGLATHLGGGRRLLLLDDDVAVLRTTARLLRKAGFEVDAFDDAELALAAVERGDAGYVGFITDRTMPVLSGIEVARRARAIDSRLPVILLSGAPQPGDERAPGISAVLGKPPDTASLVAVLARVRSGEAESQPAAR